MRKINRIVWCALAFPLILSSCLSFADYERYQMNEIDRGYNRQKSEDEWWTKYIRNVLYIGMLEDEFLEAFKKHEESIDLDRPYISSVKNHRYIVLGLGGKEKYRVTFDNGRLSKYEQFGLGQNPFGYSDSTFLLKKKEGDLSPISLQGMRIS